jgi:hypothetical protein
MLRQLILDTVKEFPWKPISILCRVLHIDNVKNVEKCCHDLVADGLLDTQVDSHNCQVLRYSLTTAGIKLATSSPSAARTAPTHSSHRVRTVMKFYNTLEAKNVQHYTLVAQIRQLFQENPQVPCRCKYQIRAWVDETMESVQSALYYLLHTGELVQCGPLLFNRTWPAALARQFCRTT